jgi:sugar lactone lactonase YvrE
MKGKSFENYIFFLKGYLSLRIVFEMTGDGCPDGMTIDKDDHLWVAIWGGERVLRYE